ncbi:energy transducer TonB [Dinghuibacter silviterrae]|uniref:TonB family protein n=1 Tax=Dinghuibacter silviterrae TaxID=1539049 RepID=A0A4R8DJ99_9BACT|nr:hypothetical protein [Dinghuibacter silviterrae]TDW97598.1 hypothetical protein EDB95_5449 [Dinghuibacter silviterrae]
MKSNTLLLLLCTIFLWTLHAKAQEKSKLLKSWICVSSMSLPDSIVGNNSAYIRYTFEPRTSYVSFDPRWNEHSQDWSLEGNQLKMGSVTYTVEELTDADLVLVQPGIQVVTFRDEQLFCRDSTHLIQDGIFKSEPVFTANRWFAPRLKSEDLHPIIGAALGSSASYRGKVFAVSFVIGTDGSVNDVHVLQSVKDSYDQKVLKQLDKTSGLWTPPFFHGHPIQTRMVFRMNYAGATIVPFN